MRISDWSSDVCSSDLDIHKTVLRGEEASISFDAIKGWFSANYALLSKKERVYLAPSSQQAALLHVMRYYERENGNWDRIKEAEVEISLVKDQYILKGSVDLIRGEHDTEIGRESGREGGGQSG